MGRTRRLWTTKQLRYATLKASETYQKMRGDIARGLGETRLPTAGGVARVGMKGLGSVRISLTSQWFVKRGRETEALVAVTALAEAVREGEPRTLMYLVHVTYAGDALQSLPPGGPQCLLFVEEYQDVDAFHAHVNGPLFTRFVAEHGQLFVQSNERPFTTVQFLVRRAGFVRRESCMLGEAPRVDQAPNQHPAVMFEVIAKDQRRTQTFYASVFGWDYSVGTGGFAYVHFPVQVRALLGGIGQADPSVPGFEPGHSFYLSVDDLEGTIDRAVAAGGSPYMAITNLDGYRFAMIRDPEGNPIGLIEPFSSAAGPSRTLETT